MEALYDFLLMIVIYVPYLAFLFVFVNFFIINGGIGVYYYCKRKLELRVAHGKQALGPFIVNHQRYRQYLIECALAKKEGRRVDAHLIPANIFAAYGAGVTGIFKQEEAAKVVWQHSSYLHSAQGVAQDDYRDSAAYYMPYDYSRPNNIWLYEPGRHDH